MTVNVLLLYRTLNLRLLRCAELAEVSAVEVSTGVTVVFLLSVKIIKWKC